MFFVSLKIALCLSFLFITLSLMSRKGAKNLDIYAFIENVWCRWLWKTITSFLAFVICKSYILVWLPYHQDYKDLQRTLRYPAANLIFY